MNEHAKQKDTSNPPRRTHPAVRSALRLSEARPSYHMMSSPDLETGLARLIRYNGTSAEPRRSVSSRQRAASGRAWSFLATDLRFPVNAMITWR